MKSPRNSLLLLALLFLFGCAHRKEIPVTGEQFVAAYNIPSYHWRLKTEYERKENFVYLDFYKWGALSWPEYTGTWKAKRSDIPSELLNTPRIIFDGGTELSSEQEKILKQRMFEASLTGLFKPSLFPQAPSLKKD